MRRKLFAYVFALFAGVYIFGGFFLLPIMIEKQLMQLVSEQTKGALQLDDIGFNPLTFTLELDGFKLFNPQHDTFMSFKTLRIDLDPHALFYGAIRINEIMLLQPEFFLQTHADGTLNTSWLMPPQQHNKSHVSDEEALSLPHIVLAQLAIEEGRIHYRDHTQKEHFDITLAPIDFKVKSLDTNALQEGENTLRLSSYINDGGRFILHSRLRSLDPVKIEGDVEFESGKLFTGWRYLREMFALEIADGRLHARSDFVLDGAQMNRTRLENIAFKLEHLRIKPKAQHYDILNISRIELDHATLYPLARQSTIGTLEIDGVKAYIKRLADGTIDWSRYLELEKTSPEKNQTIPPADDEQPWLYHIAGITIDNANCYFVDSALMQAATINLEALRLHVKDIDSNLSHPFGYSGSLQINTTGVLNFDGDVRQNPLLVHSNVDLKALPLSMANPYINESLNLYLQRGSLDIKSVATYAPDTNKSDLELTADVTLNDFVANASYNKSVLVAFESIRAAPLYFNLSPNSLRIAKLQIHAPYANIHIDENKTFNLAQLVKQPNNKTQSDESDADSKPFDVSILDTSMTQGTADFADDSLPLKFKTHIHDVTGSFYGISAQPQQTTYVNLDGVIDRYGAMKTTGSINSANPENYTDINVAFRNVALANMSPYSANFAGRKIDEGKLSLDLKYRILDAQIQGDNTIVINKIRLGEHFDGASSLPLGLAVALLEDNEGVIDIGMPVEGNMQNPDFKYGTVVWNAFSNLIVKIVSAPFSALGSMLGIDGDALKNVAFETGKSDLMPPEREKLDTLAEALGKRPKLSLKILGAYDNDADRYELQRQKFLKFILERTGDESTALLRDNDVLEPLYLEFYSDEALDQLEQTIKAAYKNEELRSKAYHDALLDALIKKQSVNSDELEFLARSRAVTIKSYLSEHVDGARIVLGENNLVQADKNRYVNSGMELIVQE